MAVPSRIILIADIEGSSGCWERSASQFLKREWAAACAEMSRDVDAVVKALFDAGASTITVKDFHRTGYNIIPELVDRRARLVHGYRRGAVPGIGDTGGAEACFMIGMHAASGTDGFLAHTLTSRLSRIEANGRLLSEAELFASSLGRFGIRPLFLSGCPVACREAAQAIPGIHTCELEKHNPRESFNAEAWRSRLARSAGEALRRSSAPPYRPQGPWRAILTLRDGMLAARRIARRWGLDWSGDSIIVNAEDMQGLYLKLIRICYLTPAMETALPAALLLYRLAGWAGLLWARRVQDFNH